MIAIILDIIAAVILVIVQFIVEIVRFSRYDENYYYTNGYSLRFQLIFHVTLFILILLSLCFSIFVGLDNQVMLVFLLVFAYLFCLAYDVLIYTLPLTPDDEKRETELKDKIHNDLHSLDAGIMMMRKNSTSLYENGEVEIVTSNSYLFTLTMYIASPSFVLCSVFAPCIYWLYDSIC